MGTGSRGVRNPKEVGRGARGGGGLAREFKAISKTRWENGVRRNSGV